MQEAGREVVFRTLVLGVYGSGKKIVGGAGTREREVYVPLQQSC
jgi:hypothetical protein